MNNYSSYVITCKENRMQYIGITSIGVRERWYAHISCSRSLSSNNPMYKDMKEFGETQTLQRFENICKELHNYTDRVIINFCSPYEKVKRNFKDIIFLNDIQKFFLILNLSDICKKYDFKLQTCGNGLQFKELKGVEVTGCLDEHALNLMGIYPKSKNKSTEWGCLCYPNTSVGVYNTCMHKCKYCYASSDFNKCEENYKNHDPKSPLLLGNLYPSDTWSSEPHTMNPS